MFLFVELFLQTETLEWNFKAEKYGAQIPPKGIIRILNQFKLNTAICIVVFSLSHPSLTSLLIIFLDVQKPSILCVSSLSGRGSGQWKQTHISESMICVPLFMPHIKGRL